MAIVSQLPTLICPPMGGFQNPVLTSVLLPFWIASLIQIKPTLIPFLGSLHQHLWSTESHLPITLNSQGILKQQESCFGISCLALYSYELFVCLRQVSSSKRYDQEKDVACTKQIFHKHFKIRFLFWLYIFILICHKN